MHSNLHYQSSFAFSTRKRRKLLFWPTGILGVVARSVNSRQSSQFHSQGFYDRFVLVTLCVVLCWYWSDAACSGSEHRVTWYSCTGRVSQRDKVQPQFQCDIDVVFSTHVSMMVFIFVNITRFTKRMKKWYDATDKVAKDKWEEFVRDPLIPKGTDQLLGYILLLLSSCSYGIKHDDFSFVWFWYHLTSEASRILSFLQWGVMPIRFGNQTVAALGSMCKTAGSRTENARGVEVSCCYMISHIDFQNSC